MAVTNLSGLGALSVTLEKATLIFRHSNLLGLEKAKIQFLSLLDSCGLRRVSPSHDTSGYLKLFGDFGFAMDRPSLIPPCIGVLAFHIHCSVFQASPFCPFFVLLYIMFIFIFCKYNHCITDTCDFFDICGFEGMREQNFCSALLAFF